MTCCQGSLPSPASQPRPSPGPPHAHPQQSRRAVPVLASWEAGLCASGPCLGSSSACTVPFNYVLPAQSAFISSSSSLKGSLGRSLPACRDRCGDDPSPPPGLWALMLRLYCCRLYSVLPAPAPPAQGVLMSFPLHSYCLSR